MSEEDIKKELFRVLNIIVAEFESDPMSVQCFDLRLVKSAKEIVTKCRELPEFMGDFS